MGWDGMGGALQRSCVCVCQRKHVCLDTDSSCRMMLRSFMDSAAPLHHLTHESCYSAVNTGFAVCKQHFSLPLVHEAPPVLIKHLPAGRTLGRLDVKRRSRGWRRTETRLKDGERRGRETWLVGAGGVLHNSWAIWKTELSSIRWIHSAGGKNLVGQRCSVLGSRAVAKELRAPRLKMHPHIFVQLYFCSRNK